MLHDIQRHYIILSSLLQNLYNLVKFFIELRFLVFFFVFVFYIYQFILKGIIRIQMNSQMKGYTGQVCGKGHGASMLSLGTPISLQLHVFTNSAALGCSVLKKTLKKNYEIKSFLLPYDSVLNSSSL